MPSASVDTGRAGFAPPDSLLLAARLSPNRSLGPRGTLVLIGAVALVSLVASVPFVIAGAWPIGGFFGLDVFLLWLAFRINNRRAQAYEDVLLSRIELLFRKVNWRGEAREWRFNPVWVRLQVEEDPDYGATRLAVAEGRRQVNVGDCLGPAERRDFALALRHALAEARR